MTWRSSAMLLWSRRGRDLVRARRALLSSESTSEEEKRLLSRVCLSTHRRDTMYERGRGEHYLRVGLSALRCMEPHLRRTPAAVLDFGCGYGRVLRFLRVRFPDARLVASEVMPSALSFCARAFGAETLASSRSLGAVELGQRFDLIWCGSVLTHLDRAASTELLSLFERHLTSEGTCFVSAHGAVTEEALRRRTFDYGLSASAIEQVLEGFSRSGYGYADYAGGPGYGISLAGREVLTGMAARAGLVESSHQVAAWDEHHDVYGYRRSPGS